MCHIMFMTGKHVSQHGGVKNNALFVIKTSNDAALAHVVTHEKRYDCML